MREIPSQARLVEQVHGATLAGISEGKLPPNTRLIQDDLAAAYGVSRQPVQQALLLCDCALVGTRRHKAMAG